MKNALLLHGTGDSPTSNWFPWLEKELKKKDYSVWTPELPQSTIPSIPRYISTIFAKWSFSHESVIIGHSSGAVAALGILQELPEDIIIEKAILVAGFTDDLGWESLRELFTYQFDFEKIQQKAKKIILVHSDNDPYVSLDHGKRLEKMLLAELHVLPHQKHFSISTMGEQYLQFPELLTVV